MREGRPIDFESGLHRGPTEGGGRIFDQRDVIAEFHPEASGGLDAGVGDHADQDDLTDAVLLGLKVEVRVREAALRPGIWVSGTLLNSSFEGVLSQLHLE